MTEDEVRAQIYFAAVCRCFPGKTAAGGDRVPAPDEIRNCSTWMNDEIDLLRPQLVIPGGQTRDRAVSCRSRNSMKWSAAPFPCAAIAAPST